MPNSTPSKLEFSIGGYMPFSETSIAWDGDALRYRDGGLDSDERASSAVLRPTNQRWRAFWRAIDAVDVWSWPTNVVPEHLITDGTYWSLELERQERTVNSRGENAFPPTGSLDFTPEFKRLLRAFERLMTPVIQ